MLEKKVLYLEAGAEEVWLCSLEGELSFYNSSGEIDYSQRLPDFPLHVDPE